jgi:hypothetical protein
MQGQTHFFACTKWHSCGTFVLLSSISFFLNIFSPLSFFFQMPMGDKLVKVTKNHEGKVKLEKLMAVRYGDLVIPSEAEVKEAERKMKIGTTQQQQNLFSLAMLSHPSVLSFLLYSFPLYAEQKWRRSWSFQNPLLFRISGNSSTIPNSPM